MIENKTVKYWSKAWENSGLIDELEYSKKQAIKNVVDWVDKSYNNLEPYHIPYKRQIYIKIGGFRCLLNNQKKI